MAQGGRGQGNSDKMVPQRAYLIILLAAAVGVIAALAAFAVLALISLFTWIFYTYLWMHLAALGSGRLLLLPVVGALFAIPLVWNIAPLSRAHGVAEAIFAVETRAGRMRWRVALPNLLAAVATLASGGSAGQEGPFIQAGAVAGSALGARLALPAGATSVLLAAGGAGAMAASVASAPVGFFFAFEVILQDASLRYFVAVVVAAYAGYAVRAVLHAASFPFGRIPLTIPVSVPPITLAGPWDFLLYLILGLFAGALALALVKLLHLSIDLFDAWRTKHIVKGVSGAILVGVLALGIPQAHNNLPSGVLGLGVPVVQALLRGQVDVRLLPVLLLGKLVAFTLTIASGESGGIYAPSIFLGAVLGALFAYAVAALSLGGSEAGYVLVAMIAVFGAAARAPLTAVTLAYSLAGNGVVLLPALIAVTVATLIERAFDIRTLYTIRLIEPRGTGAKPS